MDSLRRKFRIQISAIAVAILALVSMVLVSVLRPSPEEKQEADLTQALLGGDMAQLSQDERLELKKQWQRLSPESRERVFSVVARRQLEKFRAKAVGLPPEQRSKDFQNTVLVTRKQVGGDGQAGNNQTAQLFTSTESAELTQYFMSFYQQELTDNERAELDPLLRQWLSRMVTRLLPIEGNSTGPGLKAADPEAETDE